MDAAANFKLYLIFISILFTAGLYYIVATRNLIRMLIGLELLSKGALLLLILAGHLTGRTGLAQSFAITIIIIEVVVIVVAAGVVIAFYRHNDSIDSRELRKLRG
ncbi:MAG: NADH-quinone oxidoreductase subunit K [Elusimicrobiota bacterium]